MQTTLDHMIVSQCPFFSECGGCQFQDVTYDWELGIKQQCVAQAIAGIGRSEQMLSPIIASPKHDHYRCRLDMKFLKTKSGAMFMGFSPRQGWCVIPVDACLIAMEAISAFLPELKRQASLRIPAKYRNANLTVKTGDDGRVVWGGIGRRSLRMKREDLLWTRVRGQRICYGLETFFQANLSILPKLMDAISALHVMSDQTVFLDLYGGVGLFSLVFSREARRVVLIEENIHAVDCARYNTELNGISNVAVHAGRVEDVLPAVLADYHGTPCVAMVDPPRAGLSDAMRAMISGLPMLDTLLYLSCNPVTLARDLQDLISAGWDVACVQPLDFFPRTRHIEVLTLLQR